MSKKIYAIFLIFAFLLSSGFGCKGVSQQVQSSMKPIILNYWRVYDGPDDFSEIIAKYKELHPYITINYRQLRYDEYENELLNAFAEDKGPDLFSIGNTWMKKYESKLAPMPAQIPMVYQTVQGTIQKEVVPVIKNTISLTPKDVKDNFIDVVTRDAVVGGKIYGLPLSVDTLAMYYNRDLLNNSGITDIPQYWNRDFQQTVKKLTKQDLKGNLLQSGVALGGSRNINRYSDILSVLMLQNGAIMESDTNQVMFNVIPPNYQGTYNPGAEALRFYTDFSNPVKEVYSWNNDLNSSLDSFISGNLAFMFSYSYDLPTIKAQAPKLNFGVAKLPQIEGAANDINFANYWMEVVSKKSPNASEAWDFIQFAAKAENVKSYLTKTKKPTALRSLISDGRQDPEIGVFYEQLLTAKSWYRGNNFKSAEDAIAQMIDDTIRAEEKIQDHMNLAASRVQQTINQ